MSFKKPIDAFQIQIHAINRLKKKALEGKKTCDFVV